MQDSPSESQTASAAGVRISRGVVLAFPPGGLVLHVEGERKGTLEVKALHLRLDLALEWIEIAVENLGACRGAYKEAVRLIRLGATADVELDREFKLSMQAMVAAATFFEALYAAVRQVVPPNRLVQQRFGRSGSSRPAVVTEQLKRAFGLKTQGTKNLRSVLSEIYRYRDETVHPSSSFAPPAVHPVLGLFVERRIAMFTYPNAQLIVRAALAYAMILPKICKKQGPKETQQLSDFLLTNCEPLFEAWQQEHGSLLDEPAT